MQLNDSIENNIMNENEKNENGDTPFELACRHNSSPEVIRYLIKEQHCDPNQIGKKGYTPFELACEYNENQDVIRHLIEEQHCDPNQIGKNGYTPFALACLQNSNPEVIKYLLEKGANLNEKSKYGKTPFALACQHNPNLEVIKYLLEKGAKLNEKNTDGNTPFALACENNSNPEVIKYLLEKGANPNEKNERGTTPFALACAYNLNPEVIKYLLEKGANPNEKNENGDTPFALACCNSNPEVIKYLLEKGANLNEKSKYGKTPFALACQHNRNLEVIRYLLEYKYGAEEYGNTFLHIACVDPTAEPSVFDYLIDNLKLSLDQENIYRDTPLSLAMGKDNSVIVKYLMEKKYGPIQDGDTLLHLICQKAPFAEVEYLICHVEKVDFERKNSLEYTPLEVFLFRCKNDDPNKLEKPAKTIIAFLLLNGPKPSAGCLNQIMTKDIGQAFVSDLSNLLNSTRPTLVSYLPKKLYEPFLKENLTERDKNSVKTLLLALKRQEKQKRIKIPKPVVDKIVIPQIFSENNQKNENNSKSPEEKKTCSIF